MGRQLPIMDYQKQPTGRFCGSDLSELKWNEFVAYAQCAVFDSDHRLLLLRRSSDDGLSLWETVGDYLYEGTNSKETVRSILSSILGDVFSESKLIFLRSLNRRVTIIDLYEYYLPASNFSIHTTDDYTEARFVSEEEFIRLCQTDLVKESAHSAFHYREMMFMHYKNIFRTGWPRVTDRDYVWEYVRDGILDGIISLLHIKNVKQRNIKRMVGKDFIITDNDYYWFQYAPKNKHFWLTVMFDPKLNIIQYYIDITYKNEVFWDGNAYFFDLYLDIVLLPDGNRLLLDEDELEEALMSGKITKEMYDLAFQEYHRLDELLEDHEPNLHELCTNLTKHLKKRLERS